MLQQLGDSQLFRNDYRWMVDLEHNGRNALVDGAYVADSQQQDRVTVGYAEFRREPQGRMNSGKSVSTLLGLLIQN